MAVKEKDAAEIVKNYKPLGDRIVVKPEEAEVRTGSGIVLPDSAKEKPQEGTVLAVGAGKVLENGQRVALDVKVGDRILFAKYGGTEIKVGTEEFIVLSERDILLVKNS